MLSLTFRFSEQTFFFLTFCAWIAHVVADVLVSWVIFCIHFLLSILGYSMWSLRTGFPSSILYSFVTFCAWIFYVAFCIQVFLVMFCIYFSYSKWLRIIGASGHNIRYQLTRRVSSYSNRQKKSKSTKEKIVFPAPMRTEQASNGLYPIADDFPTCYESSSSVNVGTKLRPRRRDNRGWTASRARYFSAP
jgi:hypothetical protein